jgi:endonuclease/exonuclease/phosphatase family metal-dependent hydrolase
MAARHGFTVVGDDETRALVRAPLLASRVVPLPPGPARRPLVIVDVDARGSTVRIACVHLIPPLLWQNDSVDLGAASGGGPGAVVSARAAQGQALAAVLDHAHVDIVAGDFNVVSWGRVLGDLGDDGYSDALADRGFLSATFTPVTWILGRRLDHILVRSTLRRVRSAIVDDVGSDHAAVVVELATTAKHP